MKLHEVARKIKHYRLGLSTQFQIDAHKEANISSHKWLFDGTLGSRRGSAKVTTREKCTVCGKTREVNAKGQVIRR